jgi:hypothetical protein
MNGWVAAAAVIAMAGAIVSALIARKSAREIRDRASKHDADIAVLRGAIDAQQLRLRSELSSTEERLRTSLARDLAAHESALRVQGELRLRLFERAAGATAEAMQIFVKTVGRFLDATHLSDGVDGAANDDVLRLVQDLHHVGTFVPPELDEAFEKSRAALLTSVSRYLTSSSPPDAEAREAILRARSEAVRALEDFAFATREWKRNSWSSYLGMSLKEASGAP